LYPLNSDDLAVTVTSRSDRLLGGVRLTGRPRVRVSRPSSARRRRGILSPWIHLESNGTEWSMTVSDATERYQAGLSSTRSQVARIYLLMLEARAPEVGGNAAHKLATTSTRGSHSMQTALAGKWPGASSACI
jgi:hypothetical protein